MQQTEKYKLNLIESSDTFSPNPLNENTEKLEAQLQAVEEHLAQSDETDSTLDQRVKVLEARHFVVGSYVGTGETSQDIKLGFTPKGVLGQAHSINEEVVLVLEDYITSAKYGPGITIIPNGFRVTNTIYMNQTFVGKTFYFVAFD